LYAISVTPLIELFRFFPCTQYHTPILSHPIPYDPIHPKSKWKSQHGNAQDAHTKMRRSCLRGGWWLYLPFPLPTPTRNIVLVLRCRGGNATRLELARTQSQTQTQPAVNIPGKRRNASQPQLTQRWWQTN